MKKTCNHARSREMFGGKRTNFDLKDLVMYFSLVPRHLKRLCREGIAVLGQFCVEVIS